MNQAILVVILLVTALVPLLGSRGRRPGAALRRVVAAYLVVSLVYLLLVTQVFAPFFRPSEPLP